MRTKITKRFYKKIWKKVNEFWEEAYPPELDVKQRFEEKKLKSKLEKEELEKEYSQEDIDELMKNTPEWKRSKLVFVKKLEAEKDKESGLEKLGRLLKNNIFRKNEKSSEEMKELEKDPDFQEMQKELDSFREGMDNLKESVKQGVERNVVVKKSREAVEKVKSNLNNDLATFMKEHYKDFDLEIFEKEIAYLFEDCYNSYLNHEIEPIEDLCVAEALGFFKTLIEKQKQGKSHYRYKSIFSVHPPILESSALVSKTPLFVFSIRFYELNCLVSDLDPDNVIEGTHNKKILNDFLIYVMPHPEPDPEKTGHIWSFIKIIERNKVKLLL